MSDAPSVTVVVQLMRDVEVAKRLLRWRCRRLERFVNGIDERGALSYKSGSAVDADALPHPPLIPAT
jgi:hypothetical protein